MNAVVFICGPNRLLGNNSSPQINPEKPRFKHLGLIRRSADPQNTRPWDHETGRWANNHIAPIRES
jgi:hypothetical protein